MVTERKDDQLSMFDARSARDEAIGRVSSNAGDWLPAAVRAIASLPSGTEGIGEDFRKIVARAIGDPHHHNAWGAVIKRVVALGILRPTGGYRAMKSEKSNARRSPIYRKR